MSPYAAMFPYIHQDPTSFYANSPYTQPLMLLPQAAEYRNPASHTHHSSPYRGVPAPPPFPANPSPYGSPAPIRPYDIGKDFAGVNLAGLSVDEGIRGSKSLGGSAPFGGMFGSLHGFDGAVPSHHAAPGAGVSASGFPSIASAGAVNANVPSNSAAPNSYKHLASSGPGRSGSVDHGDKIAAPRDTVPSRQADTAGTASRPPPHHSRSASLLFPPKQSGSPSAAI